MRRTYMGLVVLAVILDGCNQSTVPSEAVSPSAKDSHERSASLLSAFFGLDNALPGKANFLCLGASGEDGMPVVLSHTIDERTLQKEDFLVVTKAGIEHTPSCVTLAPAVGAGELRTVLLVGELGSAIDPAATVRIVGDIYSDGHSGGPVNFRGAEVSVIPLESGPTLVLAEEVPKADWSDRRRNGGSSCPEHTAQVVRATWAGGIRLPKGDEVGDAERALYRLRVERSDGSQADVVPFALGDLDDNDNNHRLCLDTIDTVLSVSFPAGYVVDPNGDLNPATTVAVTR
jgi:hypothetical protein